VYGWTHDRSGLDAARGIADCFIAHLPADRLSYWDLQAPDIPNAPSDSAAGAIAASGLLELARTIGDAASASYWRAGLALLDQLIAACLSRGVPDQDGILLHATVDLPHHSAVDESTIYGDHYFLEALCKALLVGGHRAGRRLRRRRQ
jgi:unsaturated chondroitin disaccharide hydrolase